MEHKTELQTSLDEVSTAVAEFDRVAAGLAALRDKYAKVVYPVETTDGMRDAKEARLAVRQPRYDVERIRKDAKAPILALGRQLDSKAKQITDELMAIETPIHEQILLEEGRKEKERQAKIAAELKRVETIQERIADIRSAAQAAISGNYASTQLAVFMADTDKIVVDESFDEFQQQAADAKAATLLTLSNIHSATLVREAEQVKIAAEREELAKLRAEQAKREAVERDRVQAEAAAAAAAREKHQREAQAALEAAQKEQEAAQAKIDAENKRLADERAKLEREKEAARKKAAKAEADKKAAEEAERQRVAKAEAAERKRKADAEAAAKKSKYPGEAAIVAALVEKFEVSEAVVMSWLAAIRAAA